MYFYHQILIAAKYGKNRLGMSSIRVYEDRL